jgi:two-component sensor histidine kinase
MKHSLIRRFVLLLFYCLLFYWRSSAHAQEFKSLISDLSKTKPDTSRVKAFIKLGQYFINKQVPAGKDIDSSRYYLNAATALSKSIHSVDLFNQALSQQALTYILQNDFETADSLFNQITSYYNKRGDYNKEAEYWTEYGSYLRHDNPRVLATRARCFNKAYELYRKGTDRLKIADALGKIADADLNEKRYDKAEQEMITVISEYKALKFPRIYYGYYMLAEVYSRRDQYQKELLTRIECMNACDADPNRSDGDAAFFSIFLALSYQENHKDAQAIQYFKKGADLAVKINEQDFYYKSIDGIINSYINLKKYSAALAYLANTPPNKFPTQTIENKSRYVARKMQLYNFLGRNKEAASLVPEFKYLFDRLYSTLDNDPSFYIVDGFVKNYDPLPRYYIRTKQWDKLSAELKFLQSLPLKRISPSSRIILNGYKFKIDSAGGNLALALKEFQQIRLMQDSLTNAATVKQINELEANYNSIKKDKTIQALNSNAMVQKNKLEKVNQQRNITLAGVLVAVVFAGIIYVAYRGKQRSNIRLEKKQDEINRQNTKLSTLLEEKEKLLSDKDTLLKRQEGLIIEKEWLLREVHHRVKNNLQIVMSLLYTQSAYLQNTDAIEAIKDSRNRVQAISIIHQKLYNKSNVATIVMADYINDLARYLNTCYDCNRRRIRFREELDAVNLDISQAVPLGLILNEAITNSIKYAFDENGGEIYVKALLSSLEIITLSVRDNGRGLPPNFNLAETSSLGMEMMKALSKQLGGNFEIKSDGGVIVTIQFKIENTSVHLSGSEA